MTRVAGTVYMLTGAGGNIGVSAGDDGIVVIDDQFAPLVRKRLEAGTTSLGGRVTPPAPKMALPVVTFNDTAEAFAA